MQWTHTCNFVHGTIPSGTSLGHTFDCVDTNPHISHSHEWSQFLSFRQINNITHQQQQRQQQRRGSTIHTTERVLFTLCLLLWTKMCAISFMLCGKLRSPLKFTPERRDMYEGVITQRDKDTYFHGRFWRSCNQSHALSLQSSNFRLQSHHFLL